MELRKRKILYRVIALSVLAVLLAVCSVVYAKYLDEKNYGDNQVSAQSFYFTADLIGDNEILSKTVDVYGVADIRFSVMNYIDDFHINQTEIDYTVSFAVENWSKDAGAANSVTLKKDGAEVVGTQTLAASSQNSHDYVLSYGEGFDNNAKITVTIQSMGDSVYAKKMTLIFVLHDYEHELFYYLENDVTGTYARLIVVSNVDINTADSKIEIDWSGINEASNRLQIDSTNGMMQINAQDPSCFVNDEFLKKCKITSDVKSMQSFAIVFYKVPKNVEFVCLAGTQEQRAALAAQGIAADKIGTVEAPIGVDGVEEDGQKVYRIVIIEEKGVSAE